MLLPARPRVFAVPALVASAALAASGALVAACGDGQKPAVQFANYERPTGNAPPPPVEPRGVTPGLGETPGGDDLPEDDELLEPDKPLVDTVAERATAHVHSPGDVTCTGAALAPRVVVTSRRCGKDGAGVVAVPEPAGYRVELASGALTWTTRAVTHVVVPACKRRGAVDFVALVLDRPVDGVKPLRVASAPGPGAKLDAYGFGHCAEDRTSKRGHDSLVLSVNPTTVIIDRAMCRGDAGGPVVDGSGSEVVGLVSRRDDPPGSPRHTTTVTRLDTPAARKLVAQALRVADGKDAGPPVACD